MIRKITATALFEIPDSDVILPPHYVETMILEGIIDTFDTEGFCGLKVDCDDSFNMDKEELDRLEKFVGYDREDY